MDMLKWQCTCLKTSFTSMVVLLCQLIIFMFFGLFYSLELFPGFSCRGEGKHQREEEERKKGDGEYDGCVGEAAETPEVTEPKVEPLEKSRRQETQSWLLMNL